MRQLATIRTIEKISPIEGADKIDVCQLKDLQYDCVINKGKYNVGEQVIYIECDSLCPEREEFEFLRDVKFRVKIRKFRKQISEGLVMPLSILSTNCSIKEGKEVTEELGILNYVKASEERAENFQVSSKNRSKLMMFLMDISIFRKIYLHFNSNIKGNFPTQFGVSKTDETRIQTCAKLLMQHYNEEWYISEKIDGQSATFFTYFIKRWLFNKKSFGVCSRNIWLKTRNNSNYWNIASKFDLEKKMLDYPNCLCVQGELISTNVQGNKYRVTEPNLLVFSLYKDSKLVSIDEMEIIVKDLGLKTVPILNRSFIPSRDIGIGKEVKDVVDFMVQLSCGDSKLFKRKREGIVVRLKNNPKISFKVINPYFLLDEN